MPFDTLRGFQVGQSTVGPSAFGTFVDQLTQRANQVIGLRMQAQAGGLAEEEKMKGMARFYQSPESQSYLSSMSQLGAGMLGRIGAGTSLTGVQGQESVQPATPETPGGRISSSFTPQYGVTGATFDPLNPLATKYTYGETPQSQMQRSVETERLKAQDVLRQGAQEFGKHTKDIQDAVASVHTLPSVSLFGTQVNPLNPPISFLRHLAGAADETFANATAAINRSITQFVKGIEGIPGARININEIRYLTDSIQQLPYLSPSGQQKRYQEINSLLRDKGVPSQYWFKTDGQQVSSPSSYQPVASQGQQSTPFSSTGQHRIGDFISLPSGRKVRVTGFLPDGEPDVEYVQ